MWGLPSEEIIENGNFTREVNVLTEGIVDKYSEDKGFGYIIQDDGEEVLVERSFIDMPGYKTLTPGERVTLEVKETYRGPEARNVRKADIHKSN